MHLPRFRTAPACPGLYLFCSILLTSVGCDVMPLLDGSALNGATAAVADDVSETGAANSAFEGAEPALLPESGTILITGTIDAPDDVDLFDLGPAVRGDRVTIDVLGHDGINTVAALFDDNGDLIDANDDKSYYGGLIDPFLSRVIRHDSANLYVGIAVSRARYFSSSQGRYDQGSYSIKVTRLPAQQPVDPRPQVVYLDFAGGATVQIGMEPLTVMQAFSAERISGRFAGQTDYIADRVLEHMRRDFADYDVTLVDGRRDARPEGPASTLYFGNFNAQFLGLADNVDTDNANLSQEAIIFAEDLAMYEGLFPSAEETAQALANIASHELGHLLGLEHSREPVDCMATAATARQIYETDCEFVRSSMQEDVFPVGWQNGPRLLLWNVGASASPPAARRQAFDVLPGPLVHWRDVEGIADIPITPCGRCAGHR